MDLVSFGIIIDDIVSPAGQTTMGQLGGAGPQTTFGMKLWADQVGLMAGVGLDFPDEARAWFDQVGIDTTGLRLAPEWPTLRAWQLYETDGLRTQVWRTSGAAIAAQLARSWDRLPASYQKAKGFHFGIHPEEPNLDFIHELRQNGAIISLETYRHATKPPAADALHSLASAAHIFSPNLLEAESMVGPGTPSQIVERLIEAGAEIVALRLGADGALIHHAASGERWHVPAYPTIAVDPTGAGNAFCGGFLAGWIKHQDVRLAGICGVVSASFLVEQVGLPVGKDDWQTEAQRRFESLEVKVK